MKRQWSTWCMAVILTGAMLGCGTVTLTQQGKRKISSHATYEKRQSFFFWGLVGNKYIDVKDICGTRGVKQMQTQFTFMDGLLSVITLGMYQPRTAKVWCSHEERP